MNRSRTYRNQIVDLPTGGTVGSRNAGVTVRYDGADRTLTVMDGDGPHPDGVFSGAEVAGTNGRTVTWRTDQGDVKLSPDCGCGR